MDRIIGFLPPTEYLLRLNDIINKRNTLDDYLTRFEEGEINSDLIAAIAAKYEDRKENEKAAEFYSILISNYPDPSSELYQNGKFFLATYEFVKGNDDALIDYVKNNPGSDYNIDAYRKMTRHYANIEEREKELEAYKEMLSMFPEDPGVLNSYAWRMAEIETNLDDALLKIRKAVAISATDPGQQAGIIDTEAEVLWKLKRYDEAIEAIEKSISIDPENQYYKDQKEKFIESKTNGDQPV